MWNPKTRLAVWLSLLPALLWAQEPLTPFEKDSLQSATYPEVLAFYEKLSQIHPDQMRWITFGETDIGKPLHLVLLSGDSTFSLADIRGREKTLFFVNNGIHAGEPCGIDASMMWTRDLLRKNWLADHPDLVIVLIPVYNVGGALNRNSHSRANQNGPLSYGFRGNAKNLDLNRDFIKADSRNAQSFNQLFGGLQPHVLLDTHTSNGADYQHTMTLIHTQPDKLGGALGHFLRNTFSPQLYLGMQQKGWHMAPYMSSLGRTPDEEGIAGFLDLPRYGSGYAALHQTLSFISETHMLKPFARRVRSTYDLLETMLRLTVEHGETIQSLRKQDRAFWQELDSIPLSWEIRRERADTFLYRGFRSAMKPSQVTGQDRLYYDRDQPFEKKIPVFDYYRPVSQARKPWAYVVPQAYREVIDRLSWNGAEIRRLSRDTLLDLTLYRIQNYQTVGRPYESHFLHYGVELQKEVRKQQLYAGDFLVFAGEGAVRYVVETLEPQAPDSYFAWNFFDGILMQKEYFSSYVFEDLAARYLEEDSRLKAEFQRRKKEDPEFADNARAQLNWIYQRSPHYEATHMLYPVGRIEAPINLPLR